MTSLLPGISRRWLCIVLVVAILLPAASHSVVGRGPAPNVLVITAPPYADVQLLEEQLRAVGASVRTERVTGSFVSAVQRLQQVKEEYAGDHYDVVAVGGAALPLRWVLREDAGPAGPDRVVFLAAPNRGSVGAEAIYSQRLAVRVEDYRQRRAMHRGEGTPQWARPEYVCLTSYLAHRSRGLFEPLYHSYLVTDRMSLTPAQLEGAAGFLGWLADNYPGRLSPYLTDDDTPVQRVGVLAELDGSEPGRTLCWGYIDLVAANLTRFTYFSTLPAARALSEDLLEDVTLTGDWRTMVTEFASRRALRFLRDYIAPQAYRVGRKEGLAWLQRQTELRDEVLLYQLPEQVSVAGRGGRITVPVNDLLRELNAAPTGTGSAAVLALEAPNWWQLVDEAVGPNDWWTEVAAAAPPGEGLRERKELFVPVGGRPAGDERAVAAVLRLLDLDAKVVESRDSRWRWLARGADAFLRLWARLRGTGATSSDLPAPEAEGDSDRSPSRRAADPSPPAARKERKEMTPVEGGRDAAVAARRDTQEQIPSITAIYRNKSTTLKQERRLPHNAWVWDFGDGESAVVTDPDLLRGIREHTFSGPGNYDVIARSVAPDGTTLRKMQWEVQIPEAGHREQFTFETAEEIVPVIRLHGPRKWVVGRYAEYSVDVRLESVPEAVDNLRVITYPGENFRVTWERPGTFEVKAAANLRYSWRFADGTSRYFSVIYTESHPVKVLATGLRR